MIDNLEKKNLIKQLSNRNRKLTSCDLVNLYDLNYHEADLRTSNVKHTLNSYIEHERQSEALDTYNEYHNYGRLVVVPVNQHILNSWKLKDQKKIIYKALKSIAFVPEFKRCVKFFAWIEDNKLMVVFIERCLIKSQWTQKVEWLKSRGFFFKSILLIQNELTRFAQLFKMRLNISNKQNQYITNMLNKINAVGSKFKLLKSIFLIDEDFSYRTYALVILHHKGLKQTTN